MIKSSFIKSLRSVWNLDPSLTDAQVRKCWAMQAEAIQTYMKEEKSLILPNFGMFKSVFVRGTKKGSGTRRVSFRKIGMQRVSQRGKESVKHHVQQLKKLGIETSYVNAENPDLAYRAYLSLLCEGDKVCVVDNKDKVYDCTVVSVEDHFLSLVLDADPEMSAVFNIFSGKVHHKSLTFLECRIV